MNKNPLHDQGFVIQLKLLGVSSNFNCKKIKIVNYKFGGSIENYFGEFAKDKKEGIGRFVSLKKKKVLIGKYYGGDKNGVFSLITTKRNGNYDEDDISEDNEKNEFGRMSFKQRRAHKLYYNFENDDLIGEVDHGYILYQ